MSRLNYICISSKNFNFFQTVLHLRKHKPHRIPFELCTWITCLLSIDYCIIKEKYRKRAFHTELNLFRLKDHVVLTGTRRHGIQEETKNMLYTVEVGQVYA